MRKQFLNSIYKNAVYERNQAGKRIMVSPDILYMVIKDINTNEKELIIKERPKIKFYIAKEKENDGVITAINKINVNLSLSCSRNTTYKIYKNSFSDNFFYASKPPSKSHLLSKRYNFKFRIAIIDLETKTIKYISNYFFVRYNSEYSPFCIY